MSQEIRIENLNVKEVIELLTEVYKRHDYCDMIVNSKKQTIYFEPPAPGPSPEYDSNLRMPEEYQIPNELDQVVFNDELLRILSSRQKF